MNLENKASEVIMSQLLVPQILDIELSNGEIWCFINSEFALKQLVKSEIENSLWCFSSWFLADHTDLPIKAVELLQSSLYEDCNDVFLPLINCYSSIDVFVEKAICLDGIEHFLPEIDDDCDLNYISDFKGGNFGLESNNPNELKQILLEKYSKGEFDIDDEVYIYKKINF
jgi:hypothetical protein